MEENDVMAMMEQLGGMTALANADLPARIFATWAGALKNLSETAARCNDTAQWRRLVGLMEFCLDRMEMVAETQPKKRSTLDEP